MKFVKDFLGIVFSTIVVVFSIACALLSMFVLLFGMAEIVWWIISGEFFHFIQPASVSVF